MSLPHRLTGLTGALGVAGLLAAASPAQAGLLEFLFGDSFVERPRYQYQPRPAPLDVHVAPRRRAPQGASGSQERQAPRTARPTAAPEAKPVLARPIDPVKRPNWYLEDPTLRRGDIVVLKGQVLVYEGGTRGAATPAQFETLDKTRLISKGEKSRIEKMADTSGPPVEPVPAPNKEASLNKEAPLNKEASLQTAQ